MHNALVRFRGTWVKDQQEVSGQVVCIMEIKESTPAAYVRVPVLDLLAAIPSPQSHLFIMLVGGTSDRSYFKHHPKR